MLPGIRSKILVRKNEALKTNTFAPKGEMRTYARRFIEFLNSLDGYKPWMDREIRVSFPIYFRKLFARLLDLSVQEFRSYFVDFLHLREVEAVICEGKVTEYEDSDALKQVSLNRLLGLDSLPHEV